MPPLGTIGGCTGSLPFRQDVLVMLVVNTQFLLLAVSFLVFSSVFYPKLPLGYLPCICGFFLLGADRSSLEAPLNPEDVENSSMSSFH